MVLHILNNWAQGQGQDAQDAEPLKVIIRQYMRVHCSFCGGFGHRQDKCTTKKRIQRLCQGHLHNAHQLGLLRVWLTNRYRQTAANQISYPQTAENYAGTFKGQLIRDLIVVLQADQQMAQAAGV